MNINDCTLPQLLETEGFACACGKRHRAWPLRFLAVEPGCLGRLPEALRALGVRKPFVVMGENGREAAGRQVLSLLDGAGIPCQSLCLRGSPRILPDERSLAQVEAALPADCDFVLGVGSGVINDLCKMAAKGRSLASGIVGTAPSMDGYASNSAAMELGGVKTTVYTACPSLILCDTEILRRAPGELLTSGFGDMAAKIVSIADWRIARPITGEYYCEEIARLMEGACARTLASADAFFRREEPAVRTVTEGLVLSGIASSFAGVSRPASGTEHTVSHLLEMFALARGKPGALHGIQVGYGLRLALELYKGLCAYRPGKADVERAAAFDRGPWEQGLRRVFGPQAEPLIAGAEKDGRYEPEAIRRRGLRALERWDAIMEIARPVAARAEEVNRLLDLAGIPAIWEPERMGFTLADAENALRYSPDLRDRYILTSLCRDVGYICSAVGKERRIVRKESQCQNTQ